MTRTDFVCLIVSLLAGSASAEGVLISTDEFVLLGDARCASCAIDPIIPKLQQEFPGLRAEKLDYSDSRGRLIYDKAGLTRLPAVLFPKNAKTDARFAKLLPYTEEKGDFISLRVGAEFDPKAEICGNGVDDDNNGLADCADPACKINWACLEKRDKPEVNIFVMSHCPYGAQIEKGLLPVWKTLRAKADLSVKFCDYAMHGEKELKEELRQTCIQSAFGDKYLAYLECFLGEGASDKCVEQVKIDTGTLAGCVAANDKKYSVLKNFNDRATWVNNFPAYPVDLELNRKYQVRGSPSLVINGVRAESGRSPRELLRTICLGFTDPPPECAVQLSTRTPAPGFGWKEGEGGPAASCAH